MATPIISWEPEEWETRKIHENIHGGHIWWVCEETTLFYQNTSVLLPQMYYSVICKGERVEFHIYGGMHISGLVSDKKMGISLECTKYAYFVCDYEKQSANIF